MAWFTSRGQRITGLIRPPTPRELRLSPRRHKLSLLEQTALRIRTKNNIKRLRTQPNTRPLRFMNRVRYKLHTYINLNTGETEWR